MNTKIYVPQALKSGFKTQLSTTEADNIECLATESSNYTLISEYFARKHNLEVLPNPRMVFSPWGEALISGKARISIKLPRGCIHITGNVTVSLPKGVDLVLGNYMRCFEFNGAYGEVLPNGSIGNIKAEYTIFNRIVSLPCELLEEKLEPKATFSSYMKSYLRPNYGHIGTISF